MHAVVTTSGAASRVSLYLSSGPGGNNPLVFTLVRTAPGTWEATGTAPSAAGTYHYSVGIFDGAGHRTIADNDGWNVVVIAVATAPPADLTFPADIPLAPPFSYGNPVAATFNAEGKTINGGEVVSSTRTDVAASTVADFYSTHLPRAGWAVDTSSLPGPGATAFTMVGTSGSRVCVVQYSGGTVQIFYGTLPG